MRMKEIFNWKGHGNLLLELNESNILLTNQEKFKFFSSSSNQVIAYEDVIKVTACDSPSSFVNAVFSEPKWSLFDKVSVSDSRNLTLYYVYKNDNSMKLKKLTLWHEKENVVRRVQDEIYTLSQSLKTRPEKLFIFINPFGGKGNAESIFSKQVKPLMELAGISTHVELTTHANYAMDKLKTTKLEGYDGIVCVGGDGMFSEIYNGVLQHYFTPQNLKDSKVSRAPIRVGIIPAGSTNAMALSIHGTSDIETCALHIILGNERLIDVTGIYSHDSFLRFSMGMISYGYFGDLLKRSEGRRWMGPSRYDVSGFETLLSNQCYEGTLAIKQIENESTYINTSCSISCDVCNNAKKEMSPTVCKQIHGRFMGVTAASLSCSCDKTPMGVSPKAHLGDGCMDLILVRECSRLNYWRYLYRTAFSFSDPFDLSYVELIRVKEFSFTPSSLAEPQSLWNVDGEMLNVPSISVRVFCQVLPVFAVGIVRKKN